MKNLIMLTVCVLASVVFCDESRIVCRDEISGEALDWFTLYKLPKKSEIEEESEVDNDFIKNGTAYTFMSNNQKIWSLSSLSINDSLSMPAQTLAPLYDSTQDIGYILYNDQFDRVSFTNGHTKGVILFDDSSAVWIIHSIPHFPPKRNTSEYSIQPAQTMFGQSMLCLSLGIDQLDTIGKQILINYPQIYDHYIPDYLKSYNFLTNLIKSTQGFYINEPPFYNVDYLETLNGEKFITFAKSSGFNDDLYSGLVGEYLESSLLTETWSNGPGNLPSNCTAKFQVRNIELVSFSELGVRFTVHHDHSKWAVTSLETHPKSKFDPIKDFNEDDSKFACLGDINRQHDQFYRAGGLVCFLDNESVWEEFRRLVSQIEPCLRMKRNIRFNSAARRFKAPHSNDTLFLL